MQDKVSIILYVIVAFYYAEAKSSQAHVKRLAASADTAFRKIVRCADFTALQNVERLLYKERIKWK
jgi:hypothetical protein